jgi:RimJ/RimL family protein N-acetyltransferase
MEYGIQRRGIYLCPPTAQDLDWFLELFNEKEVYEAFGLDGPSALKIHRLYRSGDLVVGMLHTVVPKKKRIGFIVMFPPDSGRDYWEFGYAIPNPADRDAFSALTSTDAMGHYMFDHLGVSAIGWRTRAGNAAAAAVIRRLGYQPYEDRVLSGVTYTFYRIDREGWIKRKARLERGEAEHPFGIGGAFVTLPDPPYDPIIPKQAAAPEPEPDPKPQVSKAGRARSDRARRRSR